MEKKPTQKHTVLGIKMPSGLTPLTLNSTSRAMTGAYNIKTAVNISTASNAAACHAHNHHHNYLESYRQIHNQQQLRNNAVTSINNKTNNIILNNCIKNNNNNNTVSAKIAACTTPCPPTPIEQLHAKHAKVTAMRSKNEEAIHDLRTRIPEIENIFDVHCRIGNGTFSTVLLATLKKERDLPESNRRRFAIKHHIPTSHPDRIMKELKCMANIGGTDNVVGINCCLRYNESVAFIMPYLPHDRFHDFFQKMDVSEVQFYIKNLLIALRHVHRFNVIHRDVKPSNFLYNRRKRQFLLVDFGLAQEVPTPQHHHYHNQIDGKIASIFHTKNSVLDEANNNSEQQNGMKRVRETDTPMTLNGDEAAESAKRFRLNGGEGASAGDGAIGSQFKMPLKQINEIQKIAQVGSDASTPLSRQVKSTALGIMLTQGLQNKKLQPGDNVGAMRAAGGACTGQQQINTQSGNAAPTITTTTAQTGATGTAQIASNAANDNNVSAAHKYNTNRNAIANQNAKCNCYGNPQVCNMCLVKKEVHASRAGTPGYRPPEVLLKYADQTTAVDIWAAGVIFLSILSSVYPFFKAPNDYVALAEMVTIFGDKTIRKTAFALDRLVTLSQKSKPLDLRKLCVRFRNRCKFSSPELLKKYQRADGTCEVCKNCDQYYFNCLCADSTYKTEPFEADDMFPQSAYDLLNKLLEVNPHNRITAEEALKHPFLVENHYGKSNLNAIYRRH